MDSLPEELLLNILHRLPVKSIGSCFCVKMSWGSLIKTPSFVSANSKIRNKNDQYLFLCGDNDRLELRRLDAKNFGSYRLLTLPVEAGDFPYVVGYTTSCISVCNGLICFFTYPDVLMLWNPTIRRLLTLPQPTLEVDENNCKNTFTLWFDSIIDDYKVIRLICLEDALVMEPPQVETFSLNNNSWRIISGSTPPFEIDGPSIPILNDTLHWVGFCNGYYRWNSILAFDVNAEVFWSIKLPNVLKTRYCWRYFNLAVYKESSIALCCHESNDEPMEVWVMKEYRNVESWNSIWRHDTSHQPLLCALPLKISRSVIGLLNNGQVLWEEIVLANNTYALYKAIIATDPESGIMKNFAVVQGTYYTEDVRYFEESLVLLDNSSALSTVILVLLD